ncbi:MAG: hypothetical protein ACYCU0_02485 [Solirubrobacteraceae bacterium]
MSGVLSEERIEATLRRLPPTLRPLPAERPDGGRRRRIQSVLLVLIALALTVAVAHDLTRQASINYRLTADIETWRELTRHHYKNVGIETDTRHYTTKDVACGNTRFALPGHNTQICFVMVGPVRQERIDGKLVERRATYGGFFVPPYTPTGYKVNRYDCFGRAVAEERCKLTPPAGAAPKVPRGFYEELARVTGKGG